MFNLFKKPKKDLIQIESDYREIAQRTSWKIPPNLGWLECKLSDEEISHLWKCVNHSKEKNLPSFRESLAGNISHSYELNDIDDYLFKNTLCPLVKIYSNCFLNDPWKRSLNNFLPSDQKKFHLRLRKFWVNYQKQHEFNPLHKHGGVYSFVIWLKIPIEYADQNKGNITNSPLRSAFQFNFNDILGNQSNYTYKLGKEFEGTILFFPSELQHQVHPFYDCDEERISISGNLMNVVK